MEVLVGAREVLEVGCGVWLVEEAGEAGDLVEEVD